MLFAAIALAIPGVLGDSSSASRPKYFKRAESFSLYAYGNDAGGFPIKYQDGTAYAVSSEANTTDFIDITFSFTDGSLIATAPANSSLNQTFAFGYDANGSGTLGFQSTTTAGFVSTNWTFYGSTLLRENDAGELVSNFAVEAEDTGVYGLYWNTNTTTVNSVALRRVAPSN